MVINKKHDTITLKLTYLNFFSAITGPNISSCAISISSYKRVVNKFYKGNMMISYLIMLKIPN